uniref:Ovule protein n=1 Tax=Loa loa TaxID=7209 RepID=A0A1I7V683_LOALO
MHFAKKNAVIREGEEEDWKCPREWTADRAGQIECESSEMKLIAMKMSMKAKKREMSKAQKSGKSPEIA